MKKQPETEKYRDLRSIIDKIHNKDNLESIINKITCKYKNEPEEIIYVMCKLPNFSSEEYINKFLDYYNGVFKKYALVQNMEIISPVIEPSIILQEALYYTLEDFCAEYKKQI